MNISSNLNAGSLAEGRMMGQPTMGTGSGSESGADVGAPTTRNSGAIPFEASNDPADAEQPASSKTSPTDASSQNPIMQAVSQILEMLQKLVQMIMQMLSGEQAPGAEEGSPAASGAPASGKSGDAKKAGKESGAPASGKSGDAKKAKADDASSQNPVMKAVSQILDMLKQLMQMLGGGEQSSDAASGSKAGTDSAKPTGGKSGGSTSGDEAFGFDESGKLKIGEGFGGWDSVTNPNAAPGAHEYDSTQNFLGTLKSEWGFSDAEARKVLDGYRQAAHESGNDPEHPSIEGKGAGERAKATNTQVLTSVFEQNLGKSVTADDFIKGFEAAYGS